MYSPRASGYVSGGGLQVWGKGACRLPKASMASGMLSKLMSPFIVAISARRPVRSVKDAILLIDCWQVRSDFRDSLTLQSGPERSSSRMGALARNAQGGIDCLYTCGLRCRRICSEVQQNIQNARSDIFGFESEMRNGVIEVPRDGGVIFWYRGPNRPRRFQGHVLRSILQGLKPLTVGCTWSRCKQTQRDLTFS